MAAYDSRPLDNPINWSFRVGRLFEIDIRVHIAFVICAVVLVWMELPERGSGLAPQWGLVLIHAVGTYAMLFLIVLLHEFGHCYGSRYTGGEADEILLWPLGGLAMVSPPQKASAHMITALAGPMVNVVLCAIGSVVLVLWIGKLGAVPWNPLHPMWPVDSSIIPTTGQMWVMRFFGLSYFILLINLVPVFPFDGGRILQAWLWPRKGYQSSMELATGTGMIGAIIIGLFGLFTGQSWLLLMIAVFGYLTCWQTRKMLREYGQVDAALIGGELGQGYTFLGQGEDQEERKPGFFARRRARKAARKAARDRQREEERTKAVEAILRKVSSTGINSLTPRERRILEEETRRQQMQETTSHDANQT